MRRPASAGPLATALAAAALAASPASADSWSALAQPQVQWSDSASTDQSGQTTHTRAFDLGQLYTLSLSKSLLPALALNASGSFLDQREWATTDGVRATSDSWRASGYSELALGSRVLGGSLRYERSATNATASGAGPGVLLEHEAWLGRVSWLPAELPQVDLKVGHTSTFDEHRTQQDSTTDEALLTADYRALAQLEVRDSLRWALTRDQIQSVRSDALQENAILTLDDKWFGGRTVVFASLNLAATTTTTTAGGAGGTVATQRFPLAGFSLVESFPATPERSTLVSNPALINGDLVTAASLNIGYGVPLGDTATRDAGAQFQDVITEVNKVYVWVNRRLPSAVAAAYNTWAAYQSDDNLTWTAVPLDGLVKFGDFDNRFEIPLQRTQARYLKVAVAPLPKGITTDPLLADVEITEIQFLDELPAADVQGTTSQLAETIAATARTRLLDVASLAWDASLIANHSSQGKVALTYTVQNGLSAAQQLSARWNVSGRVQRQDSDGGAGHVGTFSWAASASFRPLPTLSHAATYSGSWSQTPKGSATTQSVNLFNRAELYQGLSLVATGSLSDGTSDSGQTSRTVTGTASLSATPNARLMLSSGFFISALSTEADGVTSRSTDERVDATLSLYPFSALVLSGTLARIIKGAHPTTLASGSVAYSPFVEGNLQLRLSYTDSLDTGQSTRSRLFTGGLHWVIRPGVFLDPVYTWNRGEAAAASSHAQSVQVMLTISL